MAIGPSTFTLGTDYNVANTASGTVGGSLALTKPSGVVDKDVLFIWIQNNTNTGTPTPPSGWTVAFALTSRKGGLYYKVIPSASAETATSYTTNFTNTGRIAGVIWRQSGVDNTTPIDVVSSAETAGASGSVTIAAISPTGSNDYLLVLPFANPGASTSTTFTFANGATNANMDADATSGTAATSVGVGFKQLSASGSTGTMGVAGTGVPSGTATPAGILAALTPGAVAATGSVALSGSGGLSFTASPGASGSLATSGSGALQLAGANSFLGTLALSGSGALVGAQVGLSAHGTSAFSGNGSLSYATVVGAKGASALSGSGTLFPHATSRVDQWIANTPMFAAHRGGSADWPQSTMYAYDQAATWNKDLALEVSVWKSADGYWVVNHDQNTGTTGQWNASYDIPTTNWIGTLQNVTTTVGGYPMILLTDVLTKYSGTRVIWVDDKGSQDLSGFFTLLGTYGGAANIIIKGYYTDTSKANMATSLGYQAWGYYYDGDTPNLPTTQGNWTLLGMAYGATLVSWNAIKSYGKPVLAHILPTAASKVTADTYSPQGYMVSGVTEVVPQTPAPLTLSGSGSLTYATKPGTLGSVGFSGSGTQGDTGKPSTISSIGFTGSGQLVFFTGSNFAGSLGLSGSGSITFTSSSALAGSLGLSGSGNLTYVAIPTPKSALGLAGSGTLAFVGGGSGSGTLALSGSGLLSISGNSGQAYLVYVWNGTSLIPATVGVWDGSTVIPATLNVV